MSKRTAGSVTKKHFIVVAAMLNRAKPNYQGYDINTINDRQKESIQHTDRVVTEIAKQLADIYASENPNFDRNRFLVACGVQS